jgi:hypothetical protein
MSFKVNGIELPKGILESDLKYPKKYSSLLEYPDDNFELMYCERFGWCIPTLLIAKSRYRDKMGNRTYAVTMNGDTVRIGNGPHIKAQTRIWIRKSRKNKLQKFLDLRTNGTSSAGEIRDIISTRRAQGAMRKRFWF